MNIRQGNKGILEIDNARIIFRNFAGAGTKFNREGDRNFAIVIDDPMLANQLSEEGWNVKDKSTEEEPFFYLSVKVKFNAYGPYAEMISGTQHTMLDEGSIGLLDSAYLDNVNLDIRPYDWNVNGKTGRTAYLSAISATVRSNRFADACRPTDLRDMQNGKFDDDDMPF